MEANSVFRTRILSLWIDVIKHPALMPAQIEAKSDIAAISIKLLAN